jgi:4-amino-4-deoxy-L-arabinose transferase-like glycosyltransferase
MRPLVPTDTAISTLQPSRARTLEYLAIAVVVLLAAALRFSNLDSLGYANHYYTAGVKSMLQSWHNFFYVAAEPGGSVTIDKPPVGLWLQAISAYFLGVNGFSVLLPQLLAGTISVIVLHHLVRRSFGPVPGLVAALALAITPIVLATDRNNTIDSTLILTLLLAAWAFIKATETGRLRYLLLGAMLVGIGFNIKMLQAYLPLPAFYALYFLGSAEKIGRKVGKLALASVLLFVVSFSWAVAVDLTPTDQRPYVGSSSG